MGVARGLLRHEGVVGAALQASERHVAQPLVRDDREPVGVGDPFRRLPGAQQVAAPHRSHAVGGQSVGHVTRLCVAGHRQRDVWRLTLQAAFQVPTGLPVAREMEDHGASLGPSGA